MPGASARTTAGTDRPAHAAQALPGCFQRGATAHNLQQLVAMRSVAIVGQTVTILVVDRGLGIALPLVPMAGVVLTLALFNAVTWRRLRGHPAVSEQEFALQLLVDVAALAALLAMAGGAGNPFVGMFLLPLAIAAASLPGSYTWLIALVTVGCHTALVFWHRPLLLPGEEARHVQLLVAGLWINYTITAAMVAFFLVRIAAGLRESERVLAATREREIRNEHLVRIGTLAAGAAHDFAQPLATLSLLMSEMESRADNPELRSLVQQATQQLANGRQMLGSMLTYGRNTFDTRTEVEPVDAFLSGCIEAFRARRPGVAITLAVDGTGEAPRIRHDQALNQAVLNLLGNAADVSPQWIEVHADWDADMATISVRDRGPGIPPGDEKKIGKMFFSTKPAGSGNGLGLSIAHTAVSRLGGALEIGNWPEGGACAKIALPIESPERDTEPATAPRRAGNL